MDWENLWAAIVAEISSPPQMLWDAAHSDVVAYWAQGFGSVAAVAVAIYLPWKIQTRAMKEAKAERDLTGVITAILFAQFEIVDLVVEPIFQALNSIPRPALAPLLIIWFGLGMVSKVTVAWSVVFFIMFYNVHAGVKSIDPDYVKSIRLLGASSRQIIGIVIVPAIVSWVFAALRICVAYSLLGAIVGEFAGATSGLGYRLIVAEGLLQTDLLYAIILILMLVGYVLAATTKRIESRLLRWRPPVTAI